MDHANYTSYPRNLPIKHYRDLQQTFNSNDHKIKGQTDRPDVTINRLGHSGDFKSPSPAEFRNTRTNATSGGLASADHDA